MPDTYTVELRQVTGKAVSRLRREGLLPANIYGRGIPSTAVQLPYVAARDLLNDNGRNTLIEVQVAGEAEARPVVVRQVSQNPVTRALLHVDFYQVDLRRVIQADVPISLTGESPAVNRFNGVLVQALDHVTVEALPQNMPETIQVSVAGLAQLEDQLLLSEVRVPAGVTILTDPSTMVTSVRRPRVEATDEDVLEGEQPEAADAAGAASAEEGDEAAADEEADAE